MRNYLRSSSIKSWSAIRHTEAHKLSKSLIGNKFTNSMLNLSKNTICLASFHYAESINIMRARHEIIICNNFKKGKRKLIHEDQSNFIQHRNGQGNHRGKENGHSANRKSVSVGKFCV